MISRDRDGVGESAGGRPRDAALDVAIQDATLALLSELGYDQLSIEAIAQKAGVAKTTIYRRHANKAALVAAALDQRVLAIPPSSSSDTLRRALLRVVRWLARGIAEQEMGLLGAVFAGMRADPELARRMRQILRRDEAAMAENAFMVAAEHGEPLSAQAVRLFNEIAPAVIMHRLLVSGEPCSPQFIEHLVDDILLPLMRRHEPQS